jgi:phosphatidylglycerol:prolipoprotein diacylglycerol transferase
MSLGEFFTFLSYLVGAAVFFWAAKAKRMATNGIGMVVAIGFIAGIAGAKLTQMIAQGWPVSVPFLTIADPRVGGRALLGGVIFGWIGVELAKRHLGIRRSTGDLFALALPAGEAVGRIGCFFNGCCYGTVCDLPWSVEQHGALRNPSQLYTAVVAAATFFFLLWYRKHHTMGEGGLFRLYLLIFASSRFLLEFVRQQDSLLFGLSMMQWFCLELILTIVVFTFLKRRKLSPAEG